ncbi:MAG: GNAT family N-acetyltransferase [Acidimicrobiales bacterium]
MPVVYEWRGAFANAEVEQFHGEGFGRDPLPDPEWQAQLDRHSLGWVCARHDRQLVGFANVAWDGSRHAFLLDAVVAGAHQRHGVGTKLVTVATREATAAGCEWLHVDFEDHLRGFYFDSCRFRPTNAGLLHLKCE